MRSKYTIALLCVVILTGCTGRSVLNRPAKRQVVYNREAMDRVVDGAIADVLELPKEALLHYHQAVEYDSLSSGIFLAMAEDYYLLDDIKTSMKLIKKLLKVEPDNLDGLILMGACYEQQADYPNAALLYEKIVTLAPGNLEYLYYLTSLQIITNQYDKALTSYKAMLDNGMDDPVFAMRIGYLFLQSHAAPQAEQVYLQVYKEHPELEEIYLALAATSKAKGDSLKAADWYKTALDYDLSFKDAKAELRSIYEKNKDWDGAISMFSSLVKRDSTNLSDKLFLGNFYFQKGDTANALAVFQNAAAAHPLSERAYLALGSMWEIKQDTLAAIQVYKTALEQKLSFNNIRQILKEIYVTKSEWQNAMDLYEPLQSNDTTFVSSRLEIATILMMKGDTLAAIAKCKELEKKVPDDWRVPYTLGRFHLLIHHNQEAEAYFNKTLTLRNDFPQIWMLRGINYIDMNKQEAALINFTEGLAQFPDDPALNYYAGSILSREKRFAEAVEYFEKAYEKDPQNVQGMLALAGAYDELKTFEKSHALYEEMIRINPDSPIINNNYAYHLSIRNMDLEKALLLSQAALKADPHNAPYLDTLGWIYYQLKNYQQAKYYIEQSITEQPNIPEVMEHLGEVCYRLGELDNARLYWNRALELDKSRTHLLEKIGQLK